MPPNRYSFQSMSDRLPLSTLADREAAHVFSVSAQEQEIIEHPSSCYVICRSGTGKTTTMLFKMLSIQRTWQQYPDMGPKPRQVFVTQSRVLATKAEERFTKLMSSVDDAGYSPEELRKREKDAEQEIEFVDQDNNERWRSDLPERFSELLDEHFPLFTTYDRLYTMLQNDIGQGNDGFIPRAGSGIMSSSDYLKQSPRNFVSYGKFSASYWDHLPKASTRVLDPALVFGEFIGVIEGSEGTVGTKDRCLNRESYKSLSARNRAAFPHNRDAIYDLFIAYKKLKRQRQEYDAADRAHHILGGLRSVGLTGRKVDFLYADEVQDNLLIDTLVLRMICANPHGLFWAGDAVQTTSVGSSFRLADLRAYQYRIEKQLSHESGLTPVGPRTFELVLNYRSHGGIVNCARSVIELIERYWPYSIDTLQAERAIVDGPRPIFFVGQKGVDLEKSFFVNKKGGPVEFGVDQCILVRNDTTKERLQQKLRDSLIMTLHESRGLDFNNVLLYNFFEDSTATLDQWRLVLNGVSGGNDFSGAPAFDETHHASICAELKFLYVAITQARNKLWIVDTSESAKPMKVYWSSKDQIEIRPSAANMPHPAPGVSSKTAENPHSAFGVPPEEWLEMGKDMFLDKCYAEASVAFQRAGRNWETAICNAFRLREGARSKPTAATTARIRAFTTAANAFLACARDSPSDRIDERLVYYAIAGECYLEARDLKNAEDSYRMVEKAAQAYLEGDHFEKMTDMITRHGVALGSGLLERLTRVAQMYYFKRLDVKTALKLFPSEKEALQFLDNHYLDEARVKLLEQLGRVLEAAEIHAKNGDMLKAVEILTTSPTHNFDHVQPAIGYLLAGFRRSLILGAPTSSLIVSKLLALADLLNKSAIKQQDIRELAMFRAIQQVDHATLCTLAETFIRAGDDPSALLCLDYIFSSPLKLLDLSFVDIQASLSLYLNYIRLLNKLRYDESLVEGSNRQRLFGFQVLGENRYLAPRYTILQEKLIDRSGLNRKRTDGYTCSSDELSQGIVELISNRILDRTKTQNDTCRNVHGFSPCLRLLVQKECNPPEEQWPCTLQHIQLEQLTANWYHARLRLILLQFQILDLARYDGLDVKNYWLGILYSALHPPFQRLGSVANLGIVSVPEGTEGFKIAREWAQDVCCNLGYNPQEPQDRFRQWFTIACMLAFDLDRENARDYVPRTPMYSPTLWPELPRGGDVNSIVQDFVTFVTGEAYDLLTFGSSYLRDVLRSGLRIDLNLLCDFAERLSGLFIMAFRVNSRRGVLHNVTLPRSWFINLILPGMDLRKDLSAFFTFVSTMIELMQKVDAQVLQYPTSASDTEEQFIAEGDRVTSLTGPLYIARICFCLCLMGYNTTDSRLKEEILTGIQSLRKEGGQFTPWICELYAAAEDWDDLVYAFTEPLKNSPLDEMILLFHTTIPDLHEQRPEYIRSVSYDRLDEVPKLLLSMTLNSLRTGAARRIQAAYRRHLKRKSAVRQGIDATQAHYWYLLRKRSTEMEWPENSRYYLLFRVPLAYILVCLDETKAFIESEKEETKKRVMTEGYRGLEHSLIGTLYKQSKLLSDTIELQKKLSPSSEFHEQQSVRDLQYAVLEVKAVLESLNKIPGSIGTRNQIQKRWNRGWKWIFEK